MRIFVLTATYDLRVSRKSHSRDHPNWSLIFKEKVSRESLYPVFWPGSYPEVPGSGWWLQSTSQARWVKPRPRLKEKSFLLGAWKCKYCILKFFKNESWRYAGLVLVHGCCRTMVVVCTFGHAWLTHNYRGMSFEKLHERSKFGKRRVIHYFITIVFRW